MIIITFSALRRRPVWKKSAPHIGGWPANITPMSTHLLQTRLLPIP